MSKQEELHKAIEKITGRKRDASIVLAANKEKGQELCSARGEFGVEAALIADLFREDPELGKTVNFFVENANGLDVLAKLAEHLSGDDDND